MISNQQLWSMIASGGASDAASGVVPMYRTVGVWYPGEIAQKILMLGFIAVVVLLCGLLFAKLFKDDPKRWLVASGKAIIAFYGFLFVAIVLPIAFFELVSATTLKIPALMDLLAHIPIGATSRRNEDFAGALAAPVCLLAIVGYVWWLLKSKQAQWFYKS